MIRSVGLFFLLIGCGDAPGQPCTASGSGFTRTDSCVRSSQCIEWGVPCADGTRVTPDVCAGATCRTNADCGDGLGCARVNATDGACLATSFCPGGFAPLEGG